MTDTTQLPPLPDRLSINPQSRHHDPEVLKQDVGIRLNGKEHTNVEKYCISGNKGAQSNILQGQGQHPLGQRHVRAGS